MTATLREELIEAQKNCSEIAKFIKPTKETIQLEKVDGIYAQFIKGRYRPFVPKKLRAKVIAMLHNLSHFGRAKTTRIVSERFVWANMRADCKDFVMKCISCQKCKVTIHNKTSLTNFSPKFPERWASVHLDTVGPFEECYGYNNILTMADRFTNYQVLAPLPNLKAETVARTILLHWIARFGVPYEIICDNAKSFLGAACKRLVENFGCKLTPVSSYSPYKNGFIESRNRSLKAALRSGSPNWYEAMCVFNLAYNSSSGVFTIFERGGRWG